MRDGRKTRARIETEALRLFAAKGIDGTSIRDIATAVGVAEGALYRHFAGKEALSRTIFLEGYADLAKQVLGAARRASSFDAVIARIVEIFCTLFDENRALFSFLLISQHAHLNDVPFDAEGNVVAAVRQVFADAMERGDIPGQDPDELTAIALGAVAQPAIFTIYGRLLGPMTARAPRLAAVVSQAARLNPVSPGHRSTQMLSRAPHE